MDTGAGSSPELARRRAEVDRCDQARDHAFQRLRHASIGTYERLKESFTSGQVAKATGLAADTVRALGFDGDRRAWAPQRVQTYRLIDDFVLQRFGRDPGLSGMRTELDDATAESRLAERRLREVERSMDVAHTARVHVAELTGYLTKLSEALGETQRWLPFPDLDAGFEQRAVRVADDAPRPPADETLLYRTAREPVRGDVAWGRAIDQVPVAVVLADAGYGKTWLLRHHARRLCAAALGALRDGDDPGRVELPLWMHAGDLARRWDAGQPPREAVVDAAMLAPRGRDFVPSTWLRRFLADRLHADGTPVHVLVDAYDEVFADRQRDSLAAALAWISRLARRHAGPRIVLTSRLAGYEDPFPSSARGGEHDARADDVDEPVEPDPEPSPRYLYLGVLDEHQVRRLWSRWFEVRGQPLPERRLHPVLAPRSPLRGFVRVPLIAAFCAWVAERETVEATKTGLYGQVVSRFLAQPWKAGERGDGAHGSLRQDAARRALIERALQALAWHMAAGGTTWRDAVPVGDCESVLAAANLPAVPGESRTWVPVRVLGILVQSGGGDGVLGDGPVVWIHRSIQEFLAARHLVALPPRSIRHLVEERCWLEPQWGDVLDFALGLEASADPGERHVTDTVRDLVLGGEDGLGWFATVFAAAAAGMPPDPSSRRAVVERVWALHDAGLLSAPNLAQVLALTPEAAPEEIAGIVQGSVPPSGPTLETWTALAWCGVPGRNALDLVIRTAPAMKGAAGALHSVDPQAALTAVRERIAAGMPVDAADAVVLRDLAREDVERLRGLYLHHPDSAAWAHTLGWTEHPLAHDVLLDPSLLGHPDPAVRKAAIAGVGAWYGNNLDQEGFDAILDVARGDPDPEVRVNARAGLEVVAMSVPWVEERFDEVFGDLNEDPARLEPTTAEALASWLFPYGPATRKAVAMLLEDPSLCVGPVAEAMAGLTAQALTGRLDFQTIKLIAQFFGPDFVTLACERLTAGAGSDSPDLEQLGVGLCLAHPEPEEVFVAVAAYAGRHPTLLLETTLRLHRLEPARRVQILLGRLGGLTTKRPESVRIWADTVHALLLELPATRRRRFRSACAEITGHVLGLPNPD